MLNVSMLVSTILKRSILVVMFASQFAVAAETPFPVYRQIKNGERQYAYLSINTETGASQNFSSFDFQYATEFDGDRAVVKFTPELGGKWAIIDKTYSTSKKPVVVLEKYAGVSALHEGYAAVRLNDTATLIDSSGKEVLDSSYYWLGQVSEGLLRYTKTGGREAELWGFLKRNSETGKFEEYKEPKYRSAYDYSNGLAAVKVTRKNEEGYFIDVYYYLDQDGNPHGAFHNAQPFNKAGFAVAQSCDGDCTKDRKGGGWGLISKEKLLKSPQTPWVLLPRYSQINTISEGGLAAVGFFYYDCDDETPWEPCIPTFQLVNFDLSKGEIKSMKVEGWSPNQALNGRHLLVSSYGRFTGKYKYSILNEKGEMAKGIGKYDFLEALGESLLVAGSGDTYGVMTEKSGKFTWLSKTKIK